MSQYVYNKHNTSCKVLRTVYTHSLFLYQKSHSFDFWYKNNSCVNTVRQHFLWSILYLLSISKKQQQQQQQPCTCAAHFFVHLFDHGLHDYNVKLPNSFYWKMSYVLTDVLSCSCSLFFYTASHFHLVGRFFSFSHFLTFNFYVFPPTKFVCCFLSNALAFLSTSLKTLKFSRTWVCCWLFSRPSPDGLSLSKKSGWTLGFRPKNPVLHLPYLLIELFYIGIHVVRKGVRTLTSLFMHSEPKFLPMVHRCARESFA